MLRVTQRLSRKEAEALKNGKSVFATLLSLRSIPSPTTKISVSVPKKIAKSAVDRNRIRRRCYAAVQSLLSEIKNPARVMLFPKAPIKTLSYDTLVVEIRNALIKAGIIS